MVAPAKTTLVPQPHGGALLRGGQPGNKGNTLAPPPSAVRDACRLSFASRVPVLEAIADGKCVRNVRLPLGLVLNYGTCPNCGRKELEALASTNREQLAYVTITGTESSSPADRVRAIAELAKVGMAGNIALDDVRNRLTATIMLVRSLLEPEQADALLAELPGIWTW